MKHTINKKPGSIIELGVELTKDEFQEYWQKASDQAASKVDLKGFRKGHVPKELAEQSIDKEKVFEVAAQEAVRSSLNSLVKENEWTLVSQPEIEITSSVDGLKYKGIITTFPEVKLGDYKKIAANEMKEAKAKLESVKVEEDEVEKSLEWLRNSRSQITAVNREAKKGDVVKIDYEVNGEKSSDQFVLGEGKFLPGFEANIIDHKAGDEESFQLTIPEDYWKEDMRGKKLDFKVNLKEVFERKVPEMDDKFAEALGKFKTVAELKENVKKGILDEKQAQAKEKAHIKIIDEVVSASEIEPPQVMIDRTLDGLVKESEATWKNSGKSEEEVRKDLEPTAKKRVLSHLVIYKIAEQENLNPTEEDLKQEIQKYNHEQISLDNQKFYDYIYGVIQNKKVFEFFNNQ